MWKKKGKKIKNGGRNSVYYVRTIRENSGKAFSERTDVQNDKIEYTLVFLIRTEFIQ